MENVRRNVSFGENSWGLCSGKIFWEFNFHGRMCRGNVLGDVKGLCSPKIFPGIIFPGRNVWGVSADWLSKVQHKLSVVYSRETRYIRYIYYHCLYFLTLVNFYCIFNTSLLFSTAVQYCKRCYTNLSL